MASGSKAVNFSGSDERNITLSGTQYSAPLTMSKAEVFSVMLVFTGTPTTAATLWKTNYSNPDLATDADWIQDTTVTFTGASGSAAQELVEVSGAGAYFYRVRLVTSGGSGTVDMVICRKDLK